LGDLVGWRERSTKLEALESMDEREKSRKPFGEQYLSFIVSPQL
jgi:hypothetical protein